MLLSGRELGIVSSNNDTLNVSGDSTVQSITLKRNSLDKSLSSVGLGKAFGNGQGTVGDLRNYCEDFEFELVQATAENNFNNRPVID